MSKIENGWIWGEVSVTSLLSSRRTFGRADAHMTVQNHHIGCCFAAVDATSVDGTSVGIADVVSVNVTLIVATSDSLVLLRSVEAFSDFGLRLLSFSP
jgi:hypothetical protein